MKQARWLVVALVLLGLGAWLMAGKGPASVKATPRSFPVGPRAEEHQKMESRRTLALPAPSATGSAEAPPAGPRDPVTGAPDAARTAAVIAHCRDESNLLLMNAGTYTNVIRFMPPLVVTREEMALATTAGSNGN